MHLYYVKENDIYKNNFIKSDLKKTSIIEKMDSS
jgi:hypothetical protein